MESYSFMTEDYAARRKEYVNEIRKSFDMPKEEQKEEQPAEAPLGWLFFKVRVLLAVFAFIGFLFLKYNHTEINGYDAKDLIDSITDNHYYTILQDYVMIEEHE